MDGLMNHYVMVWRRFSILVWRKTLSSKENFGLTLILSPAILLYIQAEELMKFLSEKNVPAKVYVGMRNWHPFTYWAGILLVLILVSYVLIGTVRCYHCWISLFHLLFTSFRAWCWIVYLLLKIMILQRHFCF